MNVGPDVEPYHHCQHWPRVRDLPIAEQRPFTRWLAGQSRPYLILAADADQDAYYGWDYDRWKRSQKASE